MRKKLNLSEKIKQLSHESGSKPLLKALNAAEVELKEPHPEAILEDFELKLEGIESGASIIDKIKGDHLEQILSQEGMQIKWTASEDPFADKFASMVREGLAQIKTQPPIFGARFQESTILASHIEGYTFTLASYEIRFDRLIDIFTSALKYTKRKLRLE